MIGAGSVVVAAAGYASGSDEHGSRCSCRVLAAALHCKPETIRLSYCQGVLMKHWTMECDHIGHRPLPMPNSAEKWRDLGAIDPVKAILIGNG